MLPNYPEVEIPSKYQYRKNFVTFIEGLVKKEISLNHTRKKVQSLISGEDVDNTILNPEETKKIQINVDKFLKDYQTYSNLITESAKLSKTDPRYFNITELKSFEEISDTITKVSIINKVKNFGNKILKSYNNLMYDNNGDLNEDIIEKLSVIQSKNLPTKDLQNLFSNIASVGNNKKSFEDYLNQMIMNFKHNKNEVLSKIENENLDAVVKFDDKGILLVQINDFIASQKIGNHKWCISSPKENDSYHFDNYLSTNDYGIDSLKGQHYFVYNYNLPEDHELSCLAFTVDFVGNITAAFDKKNIDIKDELPNILTSAGVEISKIIDPELTRIKNFSRSTSGEIIERLESLMSDRDEDFSLSKVFTNPLIANYLLKENTKLNDFEYTLNYRWLDIRKQFDNLIALDFEDPELRTLFINSLEYAKKVYDKESARYQSLESVLSIVSDYDYSFEENFFEENSDADESELYAAALEFLRTAEDLELEPYIQEYIAFNFNKEMINQKIDQELLSKFNEAEKARLYEMFKNEIPQVLNDHIVNLEYRYRSVTDSSNNNLNANLASLLIKDYYAEFDYKLRESEKIVICATLLNSLDTSDNIFAEKHLKEYVLNNLEQVLYSLEKQTPETKRIIVDALNSLEFKEKVLNEKLNINHQNFTYMLYDKLNIESDLTTETKTFIKENLHPNEITSYSGRKNERKRESELVFDFAERTVALIKSGLLDKEKVKSSIEDSRMLIGDKNKIRPYNNFSNYLDNEIKTNIAIQKNDTKKSGFKMK